MPARMRVAGWPVRWALLVVALWWVLVLSVAPELLLLSSNVGLRVLSSWSWLALCSAEAAGLALSLVWWREAVRVGSALLSCAVRGAIAGLLLAGPMSTGPGAYAGYALLAYWLAWRDWSDAHG